MSIPQVKTEKATVSPKPINQSAYTPSLREAVIQAKTVETIKYSTGVYVGGTKSGLRHGHGTFSYSNGNKYIGNWEDDKRHGHGTYIYTNGDKYTGEWENDNWHGQGIFTSAESGQKLSGKWAESRFVG